jgi:hypothetical protein
LRLVSEGVVISAPAADPVAVALRLRQQGKGVDWRGNLLTYLGLPSIPRKFLCQYVGEGAVFERER